MSGYLLVILLWEKTHTHFSCYIGHFSVTNPGPVLAASQVLEAQSQFLEHRIAEEDEAGAAAESAASCMDLFASDRETTAGLLQFLECF